MLNSSSQWGSLPCWRVRAWVGASVMFSLCSSLPQVSFPQGPFTSPRRMHVTSGSSGLSWVYAPPDRATCLPQTALQFQALWAHHRPFPYASDNPHPQKTSLHITHHSKELTLFKLKSGCPASYWQNHMPSKPGHSGVKWEELQWRMPQIFIFLTPTSLTALHFPKFHAIGLWSVSRVLKLLL